ncbi:hypothetical protein SIAM614_31626 [Stappia aggregata IAM 12614]|uniref:SHOCT domain-containing protein n=2 Tax=Roseibium aggregatum TaxID=187304 RepID=A0P4D7_ROSAI|nr:hypothetical protein SIAM614_31626 [Stappia aggregata IAM 12614] [Roseibium aggregatum IAM 12614]
MKNQGALMGKLIAGSFLFIGGFISTLTIAFSIVGIPMMLAGLALGVAGFASLGVSAAKAGIATGKAVQAMQNAPASKALPGGANAGLSVADEIAKLASLREAGHLTQEEFDQKKTQLLS